ncbi:OmpA family protein [Pokkaliibacter sp. MBI-7]|uniref:OmpA family protein n=1 Tax=Pokkaliibacter sp. MBI-7 TaxID=3040600 RepID=UPI002448284B|nr:OmpA family protein [Pokkaliibacter sp. MBI-7]MDH2432014.1 OmpA family protein [Pokkaliibacter sp. MBI-7]
MTTDPYTGQQKVGNTTKGAGIGAVAGAVLGAAVSSKSDRGKGALIGAAVGAGIGGGVGNYFDRQEAALREELQGSGVQVNRNGDAIDLVMPGNITFATDSEQIAPSFYNTLNSVVKVLAKYDQTHLDVVGYTDSTGSFEHNQLLSERRANSVASYLLQNGIPSSRVTARGLGERDPIASNDTADGRAQNRRVTLQIRPMQ